MKRGFGWMLVLLLIFALAVTACGGDDKEAAEAPAEPAAAEAVAAAPAAPAGDPVKGKEIYTQTCSACHGPAGEGVQGLGKDMTTSTFISERSDQELLEFIKVGRAPTDPLNTTGVLMPPKGGNPALSDEKLMDVIAFIRTIHKEGS